MNTNFVTLSSRSFTGPDFSEDVLCIFRYHEKLPSQWPFTLTAAASVSHSSGCKKNQLRFFIKKHCKLGKCKIAYAEQIRKERHLLDFRVDGKVIEDFDSPNSLGLRSGNVIDVYSEKVPVSLMKFCRKPFRVITLNDVEGRDELSAKLAKYTGSKRGRPVGSKPRKGKDTGVIPSPFQVRIVHEVGYVYDT